MSFLTLDRVSHHYFSKDSYTKALDNISFSLKEGEFISLLGPSGCGKSTILSIIAGIFRQTDGQVLLEKKPINESELAIGYMLQQDYLFPWKTILNNVLLGPKIHNKNVEKLKPTALELLKEVGLEGVENSHPASLSGGMRQRAALVRTLINDPKILLLDEPFSALDYQTKLKLEDLVGKLLKAYHKTAILVTHDIGEAIAMSDRILVMGANPGTIAKTFEVPIELRNQLPLTVRKHPKYQILFDKIWEELEEKETEKGLRSHEK
ncbi:ABC transporter ATP-binding protein [Oceanobacillus bengalensis]|uniref:ABC transporter ATP-binding protein n=1 Tax=Oceanobacillus bengalensis TaxID=1435466 RepID=A0A494YWC6_9BACI|nr:ABC transporter ATP-binding protein [Oceanobacillus bengalensis]RKQ14516.1 ABC transporter ATP-binding protein [Oceanobacillus bengalensis]